MESTGQSAVFETDRLPLIKIETNPATCTYARNPTEVNGATQLITLVRTVRSCRTFSPNPQTHICINLLKGGTPKVDGTIHIFTVRRACKCLHGRSRRM